MVPLTIFGSFGQILYPAPCLADRSLVGCLKSPTSGISKCEKYVALGAVARDEVELLHEILRERTPNEKLPASLAAWIGGLAPNATYFLS